MYAEQAHSCVRTFRFLMEKYGKSEAHIEKEDGTGARPSRQGVPVTLEIAREAMAFLKRRRGTRKDAAHLYKISPMTLWKLEHGRHPLCKKLEGAQ